MSGYLCGLLKVGCALTTLTGPATVQDGDTIYVQHQAIRLSGVDAEELSEPNGPRAKYALRSLIGTANVTCVFTGAYSYKRNIARCYIGDTELNRSIVASGWALDCPKFSGGRYRADEAPGARARLMQKQYCR